MSRGGIMFSVCKFVWERIRGGTYGPIETEGGKKLHKLREAIVRENKEDSMT